VSDKQIFPIKTDTACLLKWAWSTIYFNSGTSASCHRTQKYAIDPDNFGNFHNLADKVTARETMLNGQWPMAGCNIACKSVEDSGGVSYRQFNLTQQTTTLQTPPELINNAQETKVTPTMLEVYFTNTCNMSCVYCGPHFSSQWEAENIKFKKEFSVYSNEDKFAVTKRQENLHYDSMVANLWKWLADDDHYKVLQRYHILGGEPFLLKELDDSINFWAGHPNPDLVFSIVSNLNISPKRFQMYIKKFERLVLTNKIWKLELTASLDCWSKEHQEYVRTGLNLDTWLENFEFCINKPWISLSINSAISALTIKHLPALIEKINSWNKQQLRDAGRWKASPIVHSFFPSGHIDNIFNFGPTVFAKEFQQVLALMPTDTEIQRGQKLVMQGNAMKLLQSSQNLDNINNLKLYLDELDVRRNTNWRVLFPWLDQNFSV
jgi:hypothetical protein